MSFDLTIIVPVYNEEGNLERLYEELLKFMQDSPKKTKVLFINDGSRDGSLQRIKTICKNSESFTYCSFDRNYGLSAALKAGFDHSDTYLTGYIDADLQTSPEDFKILLGYINDYDLVQGVRQDRKDSFVKNASSVIANKIRRMFTHDSMDDTGCPLKIIRTDIAKRIPMFNGLHRFLPAMVMLQNGKILQVPVRHFPRIAGKSNFNLWKRLLGPLSDCFAYLWMKKKYINYSIEEFSQKS
ncbi:MAG: dolichol-phosphate mannosyltransferase [Bacteroides sp. SM23_62_1]|nr:MAG: dolichol-phosphate mannosyltransferase [Bacteroides sp. SM23_62_1]